MQRRVLWHQCDQKFTYSLGLPSWNKKFKGDTHSMCNQKYKTSQEIPVVFHNGSNYDYQFINKEFADEFKA